MKTFHRLLLALFLLDTGATAAATECDNFFGQRCRVSLPTGVHMSYFETGAPAGDTLILLHTDTTSAVEWAWTVAALLRLDPGLHIYALDQRGAGNTNLPDTHACWSRPNTCIRRADLAADIVAFMDAKHIARATLVGHAMGAGAARRVALTHPDRVVRLILSGTGIAAPIPLSATARRSPLDGMQALGWQPMLENKGVRWPAGALHMRPLDIDPDAVNTLQQHWDISAIADPHVVRLIAAQTAGESLATWGTMDPTVVVEPVDPLDQLSVPTLVLWGAADAGLDRASQTRLIEALQRAAAGRRGMYFYWKQYGARPPPASGDKHDADDIGHNLSWEAPQQLAADIDHFVRTGAPTGDLYRSDAPRNRRTIVTEAGKAVIVSSRLPPGAS